MLRQSPLHPVGRCKSVRPKRACWNSGIGSCGHSCHQDLPWCTPCLIPIPICITTTLPALTSSLWSTTGGVEFTNCCTVGSMMHIIGAATAMAAARCAGIVWNLPVYWAAQIGLLKPIGKNSVTNCLGSWKFVALVHGRAAPMSCFKHLSKCTVFQTCQVYIY